jgi:hypothetical protein
MESVVCGLLCCCLPAQVSVYVSAAPVIRRHLCLHYKCIVCVWR